MKIGLLCGSLGDAGTLGRLAGSVEAAGFDSLWMGDNVSFPAPVVDPLEVLACYAAHTTRITLGTCVYLLPLRHPTPVAKMVASLDFLSNGRVIFGVGVGGEFPEEFAACGVPVRERGVRTNEGIEVLRRLWVGSKEPFHGRVFDVPPTKLAPLPVRAGGPPIWIGGRADSALLRTARLGDGYLGYLLTPDGFRERMTKIRLLAADAERTKARIAGAILAFAYIDEDRQAALKRTARILGRMYGRDMEAEGRYTVVGPIGECREKLARYAEAGVEHMILSPLAYGEELAPQLERLERLRDH